MLAAGKGALHAKMDIKHTYQNIPVTLEDRHLLSFQWNGCAYIETVLPFSLRSAPFLVTKIADGIMRQNGVTEWRTLIQYIDDFLTIGTPGGASTLS